jgi:co-chaperonin GroES (HSP10)
VTESGILIPKEVADKDRPETGTVLVGSELVPEGSRIVFSVYGYDEVEQDGETLFLVSEPNVLALIV